MPTRKVGLDVKTYLSSTALDDTTAPGDVTWNEIEYMEDETLNLSKITDNIQSRGTNGVELTLTSLKQVSIDGTIEYIPGDPQFQALKQAYLDNEPVTVWAPDGDKATSGSEGPAANWEITDFPIDRSLTAHMTVDITLEPAGQWQWYEAP